jgi:hypothetical protein
MPPRKSTKRKQHPRKSIPEEDKENPDVEPYTPTDTRRAKGAKLGEYTNVQSEPAQSHSPAQTPGARARSDVVALEDASALAPPTPGTNAPGDVDVLGRTFVDFQERFDGSRDAESSQLAQNVAIQFANAIERIAHAREQLNEFSAQAHAVINEIESIVELSAQKGMGEALALEDELDATKARLTQAKHFVGLLNATTNAEPTNESP